MEQVEQKIRSAENTLVSLKSALKSDQNPQLALKGLISFKRESRDIVKLLQGLEIQELENQKKLDQAYWENQCIEYEKDQLKIKIAQIRSYQSPQLKLVMEQNKELKLELDGTKLDQAIHQKNLELLAKEQKIRKDMASEVVQLKEKKLKLQEELKLKKMGLASMPKLVASIKNATLPVQEKLNIKFTRNKALFQEATTLPRPLYVLLHKFHEFSTINQLENVIEMKVVGVRKEDPEAADQPTSPKNQTEEEGEMPSEQQKEKSKKRKKARPTLIRNITDYLDTHSGEINKPSSLSTGPAAQVLSIRILKPLFEQTSASDYFPLSLLFKYFEDSSIVTVSIGNKNIPGSSLLGGLFPMDFGVQVQGGSSFSFLQILCGEPLIHVDQIFFNPELVTVPSFLKRMHSHLQKYLEVAALLEVLQIGPLTENYLKSMNLVKHEELRFIKEFQKGNALQPLTFKKLGGIQDYTKWMQARNKEEQKETIVRTETGCYVKQEGLDQAPGVYYLASINLNSFNIEVCIRLRPSLETYHRVWLEFTALDLPVIISLKTRLERHIEGVLNRRVSQLDVRQSFAYQVERIRILSYILEKVLKQEKSTLFTRKTTLLEIENGFLPFEFSSDNGGTYNFPSE